jgi:hypothetical protein
VGVLFILNELLTTPIGLSQADLLPPKFIASAEFRGRSLTARK